MTLSERIKKAADEKSMKRGIMGTENVDVTVSATAKEIDNWDGKVEGYAHVGWERNGETLLIVLSEEKRHGGHRPGAGRPATGSKPTRTFRLDDDENVKVRKFIKSIRS
jgi:hypothetical protein